jgi:hypothetical protein
VYRAVSKALLDGGQATALDVGGGKDVVRRGPCSDWNLNDWYRLRCRHKDQRWATGVLRRRARRRHRKISAARKGIPVGAPSSR